MKSWLCGLAASVLLCTTANAQTLPEWSIWKNDKTSLLVVTKVDTTAGTFIGTFLNNATGYDCQGFAVPIKGTISGNSITFVANFAPCDNTITVWQGSFTSSTEFKTDWVLWYAAKPSTGYEFRQLKDTDVFTKQ